MKKTAVDLKEKRVPSEADIRAYAEHLYEQSGRLPNRDLDNWLEAKACLEANIAPLESRVRLHQHLQRRGVASRGFTMPASDTSLWIEKEACGAGEPCARKKGAKRRRAGGAVSSRSRRVGGGAP